MRWTTRLLCACGLVAVLAAGIASRALRAWPQSQTSVTPSTQVAPVVPKTGTGLLAGQIVDAAGGPVNGAIVSLGGGLSMVGLNTVVQSPTAAGQRRVLTNSDGRFAFFDLPAGSYSIDASKPGYISGAYGRLRSGGIAQSIDLVDGGRIGGLSVQMWKYAAISGVITDEAGEPAVGVRVWALARVIDSGHVRLNTITDTTATTDDRGVFRLASVPPGDYFVCVPSSVSTYPIEIADAFQQAQVQGQSGTSEWFSQMSTSGAPSMGASVTSPGFRVGNQVVQIGSPLLSRSTVAPGPDDNGRMAVYPTVFYPGTFEAAQAQSIPLASGEERTGVSLQLKLVPGTLVAGTVVGPDGPVARIAVRLVSSYANDLTSESNFDTATTITDSRGHFEILGVPIGQYTIRALKMPLPTPRQPFIPVPGRVALPPNMPPVPEGPTLWANMAVSVGESGVPDVTVTLRRGVRVTGRFEFDGTQPRPEPRVLESLSLEFLAANGHATGSTIPMQATIDATGRISTYEIPPARYIIRYAASLQSRQALGAWVFRNATIGGRNVSALPFDLQNDVSDLVVTMTDHPTELAGMVRDSQGRPDSSAAILIVSVDRAGWSDYGTNPVLIRMIRPAKDGTYKLVNFIPGEYYAAAIPEAQAGDWQNPTMLETIVKGAPTFTIRAGEKRAQDLTTRPVR